MLRNILRSGAAVILSLLAAMACIIVVEVVTTICHPFPPGADTTDHEVVEAHVARFPQWVLAIAVVGWVMTTFVSSWIATRLGAHRHPAHGIAIGLLLLLAAAFNMYLLPYPVWFELAILISLPLAIWAAVKLGRAPRASPAAEPIEAEPG